MVDTSEVGTKERRDFGTQWIELATLSYNKMRKKVGRGFPPFACEIRKYRDTYNCEKNQESKICSQDNYLEDRFRKCLSAENKKQGYKANSTKAIKKYLVGKNEVYKMAIQAKAQQKKIQKKVLDLEKLKRS